MSQAKDLSLKTIKELKLLLDTYNIKDKSIKGTGKNNCILKIDRIQAIISFESTKIITLKNSDDFEKEYQRNLKCISEDDSMYIFENIPSIILKVLIPFSYYHNISYQEKYLLDINRPVEIVIDAVSEDFSGFLVTRSRSDEQREKDFKSDEIWGPVYVNCDSPKRVVEELLFNIMKKFPSNKLRYFNLDKLLG